MIHHDDMLRNGLNISSHSVCKMSNVLRTFENRLCEVIFKRFLSSISNRGK